MFERWIIFVRLSSLRTGNHLFQPNCLNIPLSHSSLGMLAQFILHGSNFFGSFCLSFSTGAKRSPIFFTRSRVLSERNFRRSAFFFFRQLATSSHVTGVETVGSSLARSE